MNRIFDFNDHVRNQAFFRQWNLCAHCGRSLIHVYDNAHHVVPNQLGRPDIAGDSWMREVDNCVILCQTCHHRIHGNGRFRSGAVASADDFPYSHGNETIEHKAWADRMRPRFWER